MVWNGDRVMIRVRRWGVGLLGVWVEVRVIVRIRVKDGVRVRGGSTFGVEFG